MGIKTRFAVFAALAGITLSPHAAINVTSWRYDNSRQGQTTTETVLTTANVNPATFGKLFSYTVDGYVYAQPLLVTGVNAGGTVHDVVYVATEHDSVFAFDAYKNQQLWKASLLDVSHGAPSGATSVPSTDLGTNDIVPEIGITGTPVIDTASGTLFVVSKTKEGTTHPVRLHALDLATGNEKAGSPVLITASVPGTGIASVNGTITFNPTWQLNRTGLMLANGSVYVAFGAHGDNGPYHGWLFAYNATTLKQVAVYNSSPNAKGNGIWHSGAPPAADTVNGTSRIFFATGNFFGTGNGSSPIPYPPYNTPQNYSNSIVQGDITNGGLSITDAWTPYDTVSLSNSDRDQTSGGILLLPDQTTTPVRELVQIGKNGRIEVLDRDNLGGYNSSHNAIVQEISGQVAGLWSTPAYWNKSVYFWGSTDKLKQFSLNAGRLSATPTFTGSVTSAFPGASPVISSNGTANGIVWTIRSDTYSTNDQAILYAHDATNVSRQLYASDQNPTRDAAGMAVKFVVPVVANGQVYVGARSQVSVYGLLSTVKPTVPTPTFSPVPAVYPNATSVSIADALTSAAIHYTTNGTAPTTASTPYIGPITISSTTQVQAIAVASGYNNSSVASGTYTIGTPPVLNFPNGFSSVAGLTLNGSATNTDDSRLQLTDGGQHQAGSVFSSAAVDIRNFTSDFTFQLSGSAPLGDGITFTIQARGPTALGPSGGGLGYGPGSPGGTGGIPNSVAVKFDIYNNYGEGTSSTGVYVNGASPTIPTVSLTSSNIALSNGDTVTVHLVYDGTTLQMTITDPVTNGKYVSSKTINIPSTIGATSAYVGFTGGTGGATASQKILTWVFKSTAGASEATYQAENLSAVSSGPTFRTFTWPSFSGGIGTILDATKVGDYVILSVNFPQPGTYDLKLTTKAYFLRGLFQVALDGVNVGPVQDGYAATESYRTLDVGPVTIGTAGTHALRFSVTGKNAKSTGYPICLDTLTFTPQ
jgi:hypothetical protein